MLQGLVIAKDSFLAESSYVQDFLSQYFIEKHWYYTFVPLPYSMQRGYEC